MMQTTGYTKNMRKAFNQEFHLRLIEFGSQTLKILEKLNQFYKMKQFKRYNLLDI